MVIPKVQKNGQRYGKGMTVPSWAPYFKAIHGEERAQEIIDDTDSELTKQRSKNEHDMKVISNY